jgi:hypothetical protein
MRKGTSVRFAQFVLIAVFAGNLPSCSLAESIARTMVNWQRSGADGNGSPTPSITPASEDKLIPEVSTHQAANPVDQNDSGELEVALPTQAPPMFTPGLNVYCRSGPDVSHSQVSLAMKGQAYQVEARNADRTWYLIRVSATAACWVFARNGSSSGDVSGIRVVYRSPTPALVPPPPQASCAQFTTPQTCAQHPECTWNRLVSPAVCQPR